jgi:hypothetical protein
VEYAEVQRQHGQHKDIKTDPPPHAINHWSSSKR